MIFLIYICTALVFIYTILPLLQKKTTRKSDQTDQVFICISVSIINITEKTSCLYNVLFDLIWIHSCLNNIPLRKVYWAMLSFVPTFV